jgi:hypothetical protein
MLTQAVNITQVTGDACDVLNEIASKDRDHTSDQRDEKEMKDDHSEFYQ